MEEQRIDINGSSLFDTIKFRSIQAHRVRLIRDLLKDKADLSRASVIDIGSGSGHLAASMPELNPRNYTGLDGSNKQVEIAKARGLRVERCNLGEGIPFEANRFDIAFALEIIEHLFQTEFFLEEIFRVLKPGGILILSTPNVTGLGCRIKCLLGKRPAVIECRSRENVQGHIRAFDMSDISALISEAGFKDIRIVGREFLFPEFAKALFSIGLVRELNFYLCRKLPSINPGFLVFCRKPSR